MKYSKCKLENEIFFLYCLDTKVRKFNNSNIGTVNTVQKKFVYLRKIGRQIKSSLSIKTLLWEVYSYFSFHLPTIQLFISIWEKIHEGIYHSAPHVSIITVNILITIIRFVRYHLLLASNSTFMTDFLYLHQICRNLNEH